ncbi:cathepsin L-like proteinase [Leptinotarsa decemlineata]|uniref:cathepsin L-like proteinase n=1 Tax=Leptinotarsa decemlineata TaxID=7539 RepID=UPI003D305D24
MKLIIAFISLVIAINAATDEDLWIEFKGKYAKTYRSLREEKIRFDVFKQNLREIESHNARYENGEVSYFLRINQFADITNKEFADRHAKNLKIKPEYLQTPFNKDMNVPVPESINWYEKGVVTPVKNQGEECGSCWAFSTVGCLESHYLLKYNKSLSLSEQQLVDCSKSNYGCNGGIMDEAFLYIKQNGIGSESDYPYRGIDGECKKVETVATVRGVVMFRGTEDDLKYAVATIGPISVAVRTTFWQLYGGGIFDHPECNSLYYNHAVLVVGYGSENGTDYWLIKNSYGPSFGENGYIRLVRNKSQCAINRYMVYPILY